MLGYACGMHCLLPSPSAATSCRSFLRHDLPNDKLRSQTNWEHPVDVRDRTMGPRNWEQISDFYVCLLRLQNLYSITYIYMPFLLRDDFMWFGSNTNCSYIPFVSQFEVQIWSVLCLLKSNYSCKSPACLVLFEASPYSSISNWRGTKIMRNWFWLGKPMVPSTQVPITNYWLLHFSF